MKSLDDNAIPRLDAGLDDPLTLAPGADFHRTDFHLVPFAHEKDDRPLWTLLNRPLRDKNDVLFDRAFEAHSHKLAGQEHAVWIGKDESSRPRTRLASETHVRKVQDPVMGIRAPVGKDDGTL